jgi:heat shock protein beta
VANESKPLWVRPPKEVTDKEYNDFFKATFNEFMDPAAHSHFVAEGDIEFRSIVYLPGMAPFDGQNDMQAKNKNIKLFVKRVFISDDFGEELMPRYLQFVKGVVDSSDLPLNVSREILQVEEQSTASMVDPTGIHTQYTYGDHTYGVTYGDHTYAVYIRSIHTGIIHT